MPRIRPAAPRLAAVLVLVGLAAAAPAAATWSLVWSDEFDGTALDAANWTADVGNGCPSLCGWGNNELQYYRTQNLAVTGGELVITTRRENYGGSAFTSGKITSSGKRSFRYGKIAMRAKLPVGGGMWPAFWMMPQASAYGGWASSGELDIMESSNAMTAVGGALHYGGEWPDNTSTSQSMSLGGASFADDYHEYAVVWEPDQIRWYVDDLLFMTRTSAQWYSANAPDNPQAPFDQDFFLILNAAVGGWYTGCTELACVTATFPQEYRIDWVRVYEDIDNFAPTVAFTAPGATAPAGDLVLAVDARDSDGTVASVEFAANGTVLGTVTAAPWTFTWTGATDGCYQVTARALDDLGGEATATLDLVVGAGCGQEAYPSGAHLLPARIEAEDYDTGGEAVGYHDADPANSGGQYRPAEGVDIEACTDAGGGYNLGWTAAGEWLEYTLDVPVTGTYGVDIRVASLAAGGTIRLAVDGVDAPTDVTVPVTTGWQTWRTVSTQVDLAAGTRVLRLQVVGEGFNLNWLELALDYAADVPVRAPSGAVLHPCHPNPFNPTTTIRFELDAPGPVRLAIYDAAGRRVRTLVAGEDRAAGGHAVNWRGRDDAGHPAAAGVYWCRLEAGGTVQTRPMSLLK